MSLKDEHMFLTVKCNKSSVNRKHQRINDNTYINRYNVSIVQTQIHKHQRTSYLTNRSPFKKNKYKKKYDHFVSIIKYIIYGDSFAMKLRIWNKIFFLQSQE